MNRRNIILVIASIVVLIAVTFVIYKQSANNVAQPPKVDEVVLQQQIQEIVEKGIASDCVLLTNEKQRMFCLQSFIEEQVSQNSSFQLVPQQTTLLSNDDFTDLIRRSSSTPNLVIKIE